MNKMVRKLLFVVAAIFAFTNSLQAEELLIDGFGGEMEAAARSDAGETLKYELFQASKEKGLSESLRPIGGVRHFSVYLNTGSSLRMATESSWGGNALVYEASEGTRGSSVVVWDGDANSRGGNTRGLGKNAPLLSYFDRIVFDQFELDIPEGERGTVMIRISLYDKEDATGTRMLTATIPFSESRARSPYSVPLRNFVLNDDVVGIFSDKVGAISLMVDAAEVSGVRVRFGSWSFVGDGKPKAREPEPTAVDEPEEMLEEVPDEVPTIEEPTPLPPVIPEVTSRPTPVPQKTVALTPTPLPTKPLKTPTPYYGRCVYNFEGKVVCVKFPGWGKKECAINSDCFTPTPTATHTATATRTPTPTPILSCLCACRSHDTTGEYFCAHPWVFRVSRLGYTCPDKELGNFPWSFKQDAGGVPVERSETYCSDRWEGKEVRGYRTSSTKEPGELCRLTDCREGVLRNEGFKY